MTVHAMIQRVRPRRAGWVKYRVTVYRTDPTVAMRENVTHLAPEQAIELAFRLLEAANAAKCDDEPPF